MSIACVREKDVAGCLAGTQLLLSNLGLGGATGIFKRIVG
jgi:hypothetical protein